MHHFGCRFAIVNVMLFKTPTSFAVIGGTMSGKTHFVWNFLRNAALLLDKEPSKIVYCYMEYQPIMDKMESTLEHFSIHEGLPTREEVKEWSEGSPNTVVILDDMIHLVTKSQEALHLFQTLVSHLNLTVFLLSQSLYPV